MFKKVVISVALAIVMFAVAGIVIAQFTKTSNIHVTVGEPLAFVGQSDFNFDVWVSDLTPFSLEVANNQATAVNVTWRSTVTPPEVGIVTYLANGIYDYTIAGNSTMVFDWVLTANQGTPIGVYDIELNVFIVP